MLIATLASVVAVVHLVGPNPLGLAFVWSIGWSLMFWIAVLPMRHFQGLIERHTDLYVTHHASRTTKRSLVGRSPEERHQRLLRAMRRAFRKAWQVSAVAGAVVIVGSLVGATIVVRSFRPLPVEPSLAAFEDAWGAGDAGRVAGFFSKRIREQEQTWVEAIAAGHDWGRSWPALGEPRIRSGEGAALVEYEVEGLTVAARWARDGRSWALVSLELPIPPVAPVHARFQAAWKSSDLRAVAGFYQEEHAERMLESIQKKVERRAWDPLPAIQDVEVLEVDAEEVELTLILADGPLRTTWRFQGDGLWGLFRFEFPELPRRGRQ